MSEQTHLLTEVDGHVAIISINRPKVLNALNLELMQDLAGLLEGYDADDAIRVILLAGSERAWAAGADIGDMATATRKDMESRDQFTQWERIKSIRKPIVAAVSGFALGGGCELMMHCDVIICSEPAKIGQPEINIGVMP